MSRGPGVWIRRGYDLALAGETVPAAVEAYAGAWMQIGHDLAGRLADNQIAEVGTVDPMPLPAWPELAQQAIKEDQNMITLYKIGYFALEQTEASRPEFRIRHLPTGTHVYNQVDGHVDRDELIELCQRLTYIDDPAIGKEIAESDWRRIEEVKNTLRGEIVDPYVCEARAIEALRAMADRMQADRHDRERIEKAGHNAYWSLRRKEEKIAELTERAERAERQAQKIGETSAAAVRDLQAANDRLTARIAELERALQEEKESGRQAARIYGQAADETQAQIEKLQRLIDRDRRKLREEIGANHQLRAAYDAAMEQITGDPASGMITDLTSRPGSPRAIFYRVAGDPDAITVEIVSPTGHVYAGANGRTPAAALQEAIQRYERTRRGDNGRPVEHPDAGQEAEEAEDAARRRQ